uniref:Uncharacterized protein n=1 Tax=Oryza nivara TaxID=4536 RepID=A0A0E0I2X3_ORYNI
MGILEDEPAAGIRWQIGSLRKASAATWRREHLVWRGSVETGDADDGAAATWRREHLVRRGGGGQAMQRTARRLIRSGAVMAEVRERCSGGGRRRRCGGRSIGREMGRAGRALIEGGWRRDRSGPFGF